MRVRVADVKEEYHSKRMVGWLMERVECRRRAEDSDALPHLGAAWPGQGALLACLTNPQCRIDSRRGAGRKALRYGRRECLRYGAALRHSCLHGDIPTDN